MTEGCEIFNVADDAGSYLCPACGWPGYFDGSSYDEKGGLVGTGICPCCHFEPGFDDDPSANKNADGIVREAIATYRRRWVAAGMPWRGEEQQRPSTWRPQYQLEKLLALYPFLR